MWLDLRKALTAFLLYDILWSSNRIAYHETVRLFLSNSGEEKMKSRTRHLASLLTAVFLVLLVAAALATRGTKASPGTTLYVSTSGDDGNDCTITETCRTVQRAIDVATTDDEIHVAEGTYTVTAGTVITVSKTVKLRGGWNADFTARDPDLYPTTLDAQRQGRVVYIIGLGASPTIEGFTITGGNAGVEDNYRGMGGGIYSRAAAPIIQNNIITDNIASTVAMGFGGGLYLDYAPASSVISGNQILSNTASTSTDTNGFGGGLYLNYSAAIVSGNTISGNINNSTAGGGHGGGVYLSLGNPTLDGNRIISNTSSGGGGGLYVSRSAPFTLTNNIIAQNRAAYTGGGILVWGGGGYPASGVLINNTFAQNNLGNGGEGVFASNDTTLTLTNNIIVSHTYGIYIISPATATADYTLFYGNTNDTAGSVTSTHEVSGDPLFVNPAGWDYHIQVTSPAVNSGTFNGAPATDFEGDPRPYDCFVDIGADENTASDQCRRIYLPLIMKNY